jgi:hypothetical protein
MFFARAKTIFIPLAGLQIRLEYFLERFASALALDTQAHDCYFVGMSAQRIHLLLSKESLSFGRQLARKKKTSISRLVEGFFMGGRNHVRSGKPFSERWAGKFRLRKSSKADVRGMRLLKKYS